jgi:hypothetical protein
MTGDTDDATLKVLRCTLPEGEVGSRRKEVGRLVAKATRNTTVADGVELECSSDTAALDCRSNCGSCPIMARLASALPVRPISLALFAS